MMISPVESQGDDDNKRGRGAEHGDKQGPHRRGAFENTQFGIVYAFHSLPERGLPVVELDRSDALQHFIYHLSITTYTHIGTNMQTCTTVSLCSSLSKTISGTVSVRKSVYGSPWIMTTVCVRTGFHQATSEGGGQEQENKKTRNDMCTYPDTLTCRGIFHG